MDLFLFDIRAYLDSRLVPYYESGKNISSGWIGLNCPFCPDGDPSNHLGINPETNVIKCWRCGVKGTVIRIVRYHDRCTVPQAKKIIKEFSRTLTRHVIRDDKNQAFANALKEISLPSESTKRMLPLHISFLRKRGFEPVDIFKKYDVRCVDRISDRWKFRLIIPIFHGRRLVAWTSRDVTGLAENPYDNAPVEECVYPVKNLLYNFDTVKDRAIVVEGPLDVWRIGDGCVCTFGTMYTAQQLLHLCKRVKQAFVLYDSDAQERAESLASDLMCHIPHVEIIELSEGDPCDFTEQEVRALRREIFGKIF